MILYNGATGTLGRHLPEALASRGLEGVPLAARLEDRERLREELAAIAPSGDAALVHLAAKVGASCESDPQGTRAINSARAVETAVEFARWAEQRSMPARVVFVSSSQVYAPAGAGTLVRESHPTGPRTAYAASKLEAEDALAAAADRWGFSLVIARVFSVLSPCPGAPGLISSLREFARGGMTRVPGLGCIRDFLDARDVAAALVDLARAREPNPGSAVVVNVCTGRGTAIREIADAVYRRAGWPEEKLQLHDDPSAGQAAEGWLVGSSARFASLAGRPVGGRAWTDTVRDALSPETRS